nr:putative ribonuclease H-like domain-containing protein [Tanacetum cinerariifolium]
DDGIFINQDKYVNEIFHKFGFFDVKTASTPMETKKPLLNDEDSVEVDDKGDLLLVQVYVNDIIFGSTNKSLCIEFEGLMHKKFQMSSIGELTFFLGLHVMQRDDGIFISQDKYVADILKKFDFSSVKTVSTLIETNKALLKDEEAEDVDVYLYRLIIRSLMYLRASRPDIIYLKGQPKLGLWYPMDSPFDLEAFSDSDYVGASLDRHTLTTAVETNPTECEGFEQIIIFLNASYVKYALTVNPTVYTSCIEQFSATAKLKNVDGEAHIQALVDKKKVIITEASIRRDLRFKDEGGVDSLSNEVIFEQLTLMGYEKLSQKLTFYKAFFSPQWKFLIHTILQCLSAKTTALNEFSSTMASTVVYPEDMGEGSEIPTDTHHTPIVTQPTSSPSQKKQKSRRKHRKEIEVSLPSSKIPNEEGVPITSNDPLPSGEDRMQLNELMILCTNLHKQGRMNEEDMFRVNDLDGDEVVVDVLASEKVEQIVKVVEKEVSTGDPVTTAGEVVTTASIEVTTAATTLQISKDELTLAQTLIEIKVTKPKAITTAAGTRPKEKGIVMQKPSETPLPKPIDSSKKPSKTKDKGKAKMIEPEKPLKRKD